MKAPGRDYVKCRGMGFVNPKSTGMGTQPNQVRTIREEYLNEYKKRKVRMSFCRITEDPLEAPIVACRLGHLYNKTAVIECLLERKMPKEYSHIRSLKDVKQCKVEFDKDESTSNVAVGETNVARKNGLICPLSRADLSNSGLKTVLIWKTGVMCTEKALKEMKGAEKGVCPVTGEKYDPETDVVPLAVFDDELEELKKKLPPPPKKKQKVSNDAESSKAEPIKSGMPEPPKKLVKPDEVSEMPQRKDLTRGYGSTPASEMAEKVYQELKNDPNSVYSTIFNKRTGLKEARDGFGTPTTSGRK